MKKRITALLIIFNLLIPHFCGFAYEIPNAFWSWNDLYNTAWDSGDYENAAYYGSKITDLFLSEPENETTIGIIGSRAYNTAVSYYFIGDYERALKYFRIYVPYGEKSDWKDGVRIANEFIKQLTPRLDTYIETAEEQKTYNASYVPHGVLYGQIGEETKKGESMTLLYLIQGNEEELNWAKYVLDMAKDENMAVEVAVNYINEDSDVRKICDNGTGEYEDKLYNLLSKYKNIPIYLRIAAEMNIWENPTTPDLYIKAFREYAKRFRSLSNISTVWCVGHTSRWATEDWPYHTDDFYPGDEYVDWVGISTYMNKYFGGQRLQGTQAFNEVCFKTGDSADPIVMIEDIVNTYGDRKPIMIAEGGSAYHTNGSVNETDGEWAARHFEQMYYFIPMVYPEVKLIAYFNKIMQYEPNFYDLNSSYELKTRYNEITKDGVFIQGAYNNTANKYYKKAHGTITAENGKVSLTSYAHLFGTDYITVDYYLDGELVQSSSTIPYKAELSGVVGTHTLRVVATGSNGAVKERSYTINGNLEISCADDFTDSDLLNDAQKEAVDYMISKGVITGYEDGTLRPLNTVTRAEFATMVSRLMGYKTDTPCTFDDAFSHWSTNYIEACVKKGAINGVGDNKFEPESPITFEQAVKITTIVTGKADSTLSYPDGFIDAGKKYKMYENMTNTQTETPLSRIDTIMLMYNGVK